jgi:hypothetical protein
MLQRARQQAAQSKQQQETVAGQLRELAGGTCPFLKEKCLQLNPARMGGLQSTITDDLDWEGKLKPLEASHAQAKASREKLQRAKASVEEKRSNLDERARELARELAAILPDGIVAIANRLAGWVKGIDPFPPVTARICEPASVANLEEAHRQNRIFVDGFALWCSRAHAAAQKALDNFSSEEQARAKQEQSVEHLAREDERLTAEIAKLGRDEKMERDASAQWEAKIQPCTVVINSLEQKRQTFAGVTDEISRYETVLEAQRAGHVRYIAAKPQTSSPRDRELCRRGRTRRRRPERTSSRPTKY